MSEIRNSKYVFSQFYILRHLLTIKIQGEKGYAYQIETSNTNKIFVQKIKEGKVYDNEVETDKRSLVHIKTNVEGGIDIDLPYMMTSLMEIEDAQGKEIILLDNNDIAFNGCLFYYVESISIDLNDGARVYESGIYYDDKDLNGEYSSSSSSSNSNDDNGDESINDTSLSQFSPIKRVDENDIDIDNIKINNFF